MNKEKKILGCWGQIRRAYLTEHKPAAYSTMVMGRELYAQMNSITIRRERSFAKKLLQWL